MHQKLIYMGAVSLSMATATYAQSSVTLYGIASGNIAYVSNAQTAAKSAQGGPVGGRQIAQLDGGSSALAASRWGLRGSEDLGGGLQAVFNLENGFSINNGTLSQGGAEFGRVAWVGISGNVGSITLGRQADSMVDLVAPLTFALNWGYFNSHPDDYDNLDFSKRINNSIKFTSPALGGVKFSGLYSFGGVAGSFSQNQVWSAGASYTNGSLGLAVSYVSARNPNNSLYGTNANATVTGNNMGSLGSSNAPEANPVFAGFASAGSTQIFASAATYTLAKAIFGIAYTNTRFRDLGSEGALNPLGYTGTATFNNVEASFRYQITPALRVGASYDYTQRGAVDATQGAKYQQFNLGADYYLSKATDLYLIGAFQHASGTDSLKQPAVASLTGLTPSATDRQLGIVAGIKHLF
jgi:predicted porin